MPAFRLAAALLAGLMAAGAARAQVDPGARAFLQCRACHSLAVGEASKAGPNLHGMFGAKAGTRPDFDYSPALKASKIVWSDETLDAFIQAPATAIPGNRMGFGGVADPAKRAALTAYLKAQTK